jgi:hypothetical protein
VLEMRGKFLMNERVNLSWAQYDGADSSDRRNAGEFRGAD